MPDRLTVVLNAQVTGFVLGEDKKPTHMRISVLDSHGELWEVGQAKLDDKQRGRLAGMGEKSSESITEQKLIVLIQAQGWNSDGWTLVEPILKQNVRDTREPETINFDEIHKDKIATSPTSDHNTEETPPAAEPVAEETPPVAEPVAEETPPVTEPVSEESKPRRQRRSRKPAEEAPPAAEAPSEPEVPPATEPVSEGPKKASGQTRQANMRALLEGKKWRIESENSSEEGITSTSGFHLKHWYRLVEIDTGETCVVGKGEMTQYAGIKPPRKRRTTTVTTAKAGFRSAFADADGPVGIAGELPVTEPEPEESKPKRQRRARAAPPEAEATAPPEAEATAPPEKPKRQRRSRAKPTEETPPAAEGEALSHLENPGAESEELDGGDPGAEGQAPIDLEELIREAEGTSDQELLNPSEEDLTIKITDDENDPSDGAPSGVGTTEGPDTDFSFMDETPS